jgi:hypothetical protein
MRREKHVGFCCGNQEDEEMLRKPGISQRLSASEEGLGCMELKLCYCDVQITQ